MDLIPAYLPVAFILTTGFAVVLFARAVSGHRKTLAIVLAWLAFQAAVALTGFYTVTDTLPPRMLLLVLPPLLSIAGLFSTKAGRRYLDALRIEALTLLHIVRIPVELVLFWLFLHNAVPQLMTFEGRNLDVISGLTAPLVWYFGFVRKQLSTSIVLVWNFLCLGLLVNIAWHGILSVPTPFQAFAFDQPNIALLHFPYIWLPCFIVPIVLLAHLVSIRQLLRSPRM